MTLAFALRGSDGLVLGSDSRASGPEGSTDTSTKFLQINREIGVLTWGLAEVGYTGINNLFNVVNRPSDFGTKKRLVYLTEIIDAAGKIFKQTYDEYIEKQKQTDKNFDEQNPLLNTGFVLGGYDANETNQFKIYSWQSQSQFEIVESPTDLIAAQWSISQYLNMHLYYPEMNVEQLRRLAVFMLIETEKISSTVGGQLQIATVTLDRGFQRVSEKEISDIIHENQPLFAKFRKILLENFRKNG